MIKISEEIIKVLDNLAEKFGIVIDWSSQNIVPYLQEVAGRCVNYKMYTAIMWIVVMGFILIVGCWILKFLWNDYKKNYVGIVRTKGNLIDGSIICIAVIILCLILIVVNIMTIIACLTFPEKIVLDYLTAL